MSRRRLLVVLAAVVVTAGLVLLGSRTWRTPERPAQVEPPARALLLVTIDTLRADRLGAYGLATARTPALDRIARDGVRFDRAFATAPITLTSHASLLTGLYPPRHGARPNGMPMSPTVVTLTTILKDAGFATAAFVAAFPLDRRFGLVRGFDVYSDRMPRDTDGRLQNERAGARVVDEALAWVAGRRTPWFLWVHLFEPHAPYGDRLRSSARATRSTAAAAPGSRS